LPFQSVLHGCLLTPPLAEPFREKPFLRSVLVSQNFLAITDLVSFKAFQKSRMDLSSSQPPGEGRTAPPPPPHTLPYLCQAWELLGPWGLTNHRRRTFLTFAGFDSHWTLVHVLKLNVGFQGINLEAIV
jgi:hypothetical protein